MFRKVTTMSCFTQLLNDENGFIVSAELVLVSTIVVLGMIVGLSELSLNINNELEDVGSAFNSIQQGYHVDGMNGHKACTTGSCFRDHNDYCAEQGNVW